MRSFLNNRPIFNPKPPLKSSESQLSPQNARCSLANTPGALIRKNTVPYIWVTEIMKGSNSNLVHFRLERGKHIITL